MYKSLASKLISDSASMSVMPAYETYGKVTQVVGLVIEAIVPEASLGGLCALYAAWDSEPVYAEVVGFKGENVLLMPLMDVRGIRPGSRVKVVESQSYIPVGEELLGRILNGLGVPIDGGIPLNDTGKKSYLYKEPSDPLKRRMIETPLDLGVKAINTFITCGEGQRIGIMAGSGVGKSVLLSMMARNTNADINVIALIGERGREVRDFIEKNLGEEGLKRSVIVVATSDQSPLMRMRGAYVATAIAEYFRDTGRKVLFMMDSVTRFGMAQREIGLAVGEPPTTRGYTPSVFANLPKLLERAGTSPERGSITGLYTVLVDGDDINDPIGDSVRSIVDGHIVLSRDLASRNHYPAIDVLGSVSRVMTDVVSKERKNLAARARDLLATYRDAQDLVNIGAYVKGSSKKIDQSLLVIDELNSFLRQDMFESFTLDESWKALGAVLNKLDSGENR